MQEKVCTKCKNKKSIEEFSKCSNPKFKDGRQYQCKSCRTEIQREYRQTTRGKLTVKKDNDKGLHRKRKYATSEKGRKLHKAVEAKRRAIKLKATPGWADIEAIKEFYRNCPEGYHVDHIHPLKGETICGLHVLANLQYLPAKENLSKGNKLLCHK